MIKPPCLLSTVITVFLFVIGSSGTYSQTSTWREIDRAQLSFVSNDIQAHTSKGTYYTLDFEELSESILSSESGEVIELPLGNGKTERFSLVLNTTMHPELDLRYPNIKAFNIISETNRSTWGKLDVSPRGFSILIMQPGKPMLFIDRFLKSNNNIYVMYEPQDYVATLEASCGVHEDGELEFDLNERGSRDFEFNDCELKTYELAVAATGEFSQEFGGTIELGLAGVVAVVNRMNAVYETDFGLTTTLIPNNDELIYLDPETDPYTNSSPPAMLNENQGNINAVIGSSNYDIGHVFGLGGGGGVVGIAQFNSACNDGKARCSSRLASNNPANPFNIGLTCHEMGHQMGGSHSYNNSCGGNRSDNNAVEPGSGVTILSYSGICPPNVQANWNINFHGWTMAQMGVNIESDGCSTISALDNTAPVIEPLENQVVIPVATPFVLTAVANDPDGDSLTYSWEQIDNEITDDTPPLSTWTEGPVFRAFAPTTDPSRYFPPLPTVESSTWEVLPSVPREMNFRVTVRDNAPGGGCAKYDDVNVDISGLVGPFVLNYPSESGIVWQSFSQETILWDVAGTAGFPTFASTVDIFLSTNSGFDYDIQLADDVPNTGSLTIEVPPIPTVSAKIMVMNSEGVFFDVSNSNFVIEGISEGFQLLPTANEAVLCQGEGFTYNIEVGTAFDFEGSITLEALNVPDELVVELTNNEITPEEQTTVTISGTENVVPGQYEIVISGTSGEFENAQPFTLFLNEAEPEPVSLLFPEAEASVPSVFTFSWEPSASPTAIYSLEIALDPDFEDIFEISENIEETSKIVSNLPAEDTLFWRVGMSTDCGEALSAAQSFETQSCVLGLPDNLPVEIPPIASTVQSELMVPLSGTIAGIRLTNLVGLHSRMRDLTATLISPAGVEVMLFDSICGSDDDFNFSFADDGLTEIDCPPTSGLFYAPIDPLNVFIGEDPQGTWTLNMVDENNGSGGSIEGWQLEICYDEGLTTTAEYRALGIDVYPNPSSGNIQIRLNDTTRFEILELYEVSGKLLEKINLRNEKPLLNMDISAYPAGVYFLSFTSNNGSTESVKLVKTD